MSESKVIGKQDSDASTFRKELFKLMPGYQWTVHKSRPSDICIIATGIQSSGFNRLSTLEVIRKQSGEKTEYRVKSAGFGKRAPWMHAVTDGTLARALRSLQRHYEAVSATYSSLAFSIQAGRATKEKDATQ